MSGPVDPCEGCPGVHPNGRSRELLSNYVATDE